MAINAAFTPQLATVNIAVTGTSASVALNNTVGISGNQVRIFNNGSSVSFIAFGTSSSVTATITSIPIAPNSVEVMGVPGGTTYIAAIGTTGNTIYFTMGEGL